VYTVTCVFLPFSCEYHTHTLVYFTVTCHTCVERCTPKSFLTVLALFLTHMSNFPMFLGCPKVTFSYAFMYLTHWPSHTLSPCVKIACTHVIHMQPSYFIQVRWFLLRVRATAIRRYRDNDAVCVLIVHVCVLFITRTQFCIMRFRH